MKPITNLSAENLRSFKTTLWELYERTFRKSALLAIPEVAELLETPNSAYTKYQIFFSIVRSALQKFDKYAPGQRIQHVAVLPDNTRTAKIVSDFKEFITKKGANYSYICPYCGEPLLNQKNPDGTWRVSGCKKCNAVMDDTWLVDKDEMDIIVQPTAITGMSIQPSTPYQLPLKRFSYHNGRVWNFFYNRGMYYALCFFKHPLIEDYGPDGSWSDICGVYFLNEEETGSAYEMFERIVYIETCDYLLNLKKNFQMGDAPIELFGGLEESVNQEREIWNEWCQNAVRNSFGHLA